MIAPREYTSAAEMHAAHKARMARLWAKPKKKVIDPSVKKAVPRILGTFDDHVVTWRRYLRAINSCSDEKSHPTNKPSVKEIIRSLCVGTPYTYDDVVGASRQRSLVAHRHFVQTEVIRIRKDLSIANIARMFNRDHTSLLHVIEKEKLRERSIVAPVQKRDRALLMFGGEWLSIREIAIRCNMNPSTLGDRLRNNRKDLKRALALPFFGRLIMCGDVPAWKLAGEGSGL